MDSERKCFVHMLGVLIMGTDFVLDYVQIMTYWKNGPATRDLFFTSIAIMAIVPAMLSFYLAMIFTSSKSMYLYKGICAPVNNGEDVLSRMFSIPGISRVLGGPSCTLCLGITSLFMSFAADVFMFIFLFIIFFPFMFVIVTMTPVAELYIGWRDMEEKDLKRYYLVRYLNGPFEAFPQAIINSIFMYRTERASGTSIVSLSFSFVSVFQVLYQVIGVGRYCCGKSHRVWNGAGTFFETITHDAGGKDDSDESSSST